MKLRIHPSRLSGLAVAPPSKSVAHRYLIAAALANGESRIEGISSSEDISATVDCLRALGAEITLGGEAATVLGFDPRTAAPRGPLGCRESGSTLRFLLPLAWLSGSPVTLTAGGRLPERPLTVYEEIAAREGLLLEREGAVIRASGRLRGGEYTVSGNISSQFITGLLFALPFTGRDSVIHLLPPVESRSYLDLSLEALSRFGLAARFTDELTLTVPATDRLTPCSCQVEGDYSNAAFLDALTLLGHEVTVGGLSDGSRQGDRVYREHFAALKDGTPTISLADCPDLGPILMAMAADLHGARFVNTGRLRLKESDRGVAMAAELAKLGARVSLADEEITVLPSELHPPKEEIDGHNDHRIVMATATLMTRYGGVIRGCEAVKKSYPDYFTTLESLGCEVTYYENE
ncbi:MAG: 3-phosphoshikimate 1-carboxyvinyltransferase [Clostridia bacterium]|nr:3-phosphoshikimate 1-carboxyvinyltransferase [Clostridia bacterium]